MVDPFLADRLATARFGDRLIRVPGGRYFLLSKDRKRGTWMWAYEVDEMGAAIRDAAEPTARMLRWSIWLNFPFILAVMVILFNLDIDLDAFGQIFSIASGIAMLAGLPLSALFLHARAMGAVMRQIEERLAMRDWIDAPRHKAKHSPDRLESVVLMLVAPNLIASFLCWIEPTMLNNTPLTRSSLSWVTIAALAILLLRRIVGRSGRRIVGAPEEPASSPSADAPTGRRRRVLASQQGPC